MKVLIVKTSSMGDIIHTLPAVTDVHQHRSDVEFDWLVETTFAEIPAWHPAVRHVIPVAFRRLRKHFWRLWFKPEWRDFKKQLRQQKYDLIIDAQGLLKSAWLARLAKGSRAGFGWQSAREPIAICFYQKKFSVAKNLHAVTRLRELFAKIFHYQFDPAKIDYGLDATQVAWPTPQLPAPYTVFIANTSSPNKAWPINYWRKLLAKMLSHQQHVVIPGGYAHEYPLIEKIISGFNNVTMIKNSSLQQLQQIIAHAQAIVSVDTGLAHLAAALGKPTITLYGPTDPQKIGTLGQQQIHLQAEAVTNINAIQPEQVWQTLQSLLINHD